MSNQKERGRAPLKLLKTRARPALNFPKLVGIVRSNLGVETVDRKVKKALQDYDLSYLAVGDMGKARKLDKVLRIAANHLFKLKRYYGIAEFEKFVAENSDLPTASVHPSLLKNASAGQSKPSLAEGKGVVTMNGKKGTAAETKNPETQIQPSIPLKHIEYIVALNGAHAQVRCIQVFTNDAQHSVEAVYAFPLPDEATVSGCIMKIGKKKIKADLKERNQARQEFDQAVSAGHHGALMEQERPNIFTMNVGGIEPGETIKVNISYTQRIPWQDGGGRFRVPLVVAPRFIPGVPTGNQGGGWSSDTDEVPDASRITPNVAPEGVPYNASISVSFAPGFRCQLTCPSHDMIIMDRTVAKDAKIELKTGDIQTDRDFTLVYKSLSKRPEVAIFQNAGKDESFCLVNILPPGDVSTVPSDVVFLLDISGSMSGAKLDGLKVLAKKIVTKIKEQQLGHRIGLVAYETNPHVLAQLSTDYDQLVKSIDMMRSMSQTYLGKGLHAAYQLFVESSRPKVIVLVADGQTEDMTTIDPKVRILSIGIDSAINDSTLKDLAQKTNGTYVNYFPGEDFDRAANSLIGMFSGPVLRGVKVDGQAEVAGLTDVFSGRPATIALRFDGELSAEIKISGHDPSGQEQIWTIKPETGKDCDFAPQIWAREAIRETPDKIKQVALSLKYGVICSGTSFVAISEKEVPGEKPVRVEIPVNLPMGWVYDKVFGSLSKGMGVPTSMSFASKSGLIGARSNSMGLGSIRSFCDDPTVYGDAGGVEIDEVCFEDSGADSLVCYAEDEACEEVTECFEDMPMGSADNEEPVEERFVLEATDPVDRLISILIEVNNGHRTVAETYFASLKLTVKEIKSWSEEKRAKALYFVIRLRAFGLKLDKSLMDALAVPPKNSPESDCWQYLTAKEMGIGTKGTPTVPMNMDGAYFIVRKMGVKIRQPEDCWSLVP